MDQLRNILPRVLAQRGLSDEGFAAHIVYTSQQWIEKALPALRGIITVHLLDERGELVINVAHSIAAEEVHRTSPELLMFLKEEFPTRCPKKVRIQRT